jgi:serine/threonine-protein kinase
MGAVYKAHDSELGRMVALKLVHPELATSPQIMQRFKQELLLASKITHKNILRIHDLGDVDGVKFISMVFVEGSDMARVIEKSGGLTIERALKYAKQLCGALQAAHDEGVVHRDLKPQNVLIDQADNLYVSDFGLAKSLGADLTAMTRVGQVLGTPRYMSPEQVEAKDVDHRSDLYSLGLIFYEMFTATLPFRAESTLQLMYKHVNEAPLDPRMACPGLPPYIANVIMKCLEKDPAKRYQSAHEILADLESQSAPAPSPPSGTTTISIQLPRPSRPTWWIAAASVLVIVAVVLLIPATRHRIFRSGELAAKTGQPVIAHYLAVLPFRVTTDEENTKYLADGVVDSLSAKLSALKNVYVAPTNAVNAAAKEQDPQKLARALGVKMLLRGTVTTGANDAISITVSLDDVANQGRTMLHQDFSGVRGDLLTLEDNIFKQLASTLDIKQTTDELARTTAVPTESTGAYDLYLKARNLWRGAQNTNQLQTAMGLFDQAIQRDPRFALAYAGLADVDRKMFDLTKDGVWAQKALGAAQHAEELNDNLPEVHFTLGSIYTATGRTAEGIAELQRALQLAPNSDEALRRLGTAYMKAGQQQDALAAYTKATEVNPYLYTNYNQLGNAYFQLGQNDRAMQAFQRVTELAPDRGEGWANLGVVLYRQGMWNDAIPKFQKAIDLQPDASYYANLGTAYFFLGRYDEAVKRFEKAVSMSPNDPGFRVYLADAYRWSGQTAKATATYDQAISLAYKSIEVDPRNADALGNLAISYAKKGDIAQGLDRIARARAIDMKSNWLMYEEATVYTLAGKTPEALASLKQALENGYSLEEAKADPELKGLRATPEFAQLAKQIAQAPAKPAPSGK